MEDEKEAVVELEDDAFADAAEGHDGVAFEVFDAGLDGAEEEGAGEADVVEGLVEDARGEGAEVSGDVGEFGHGVLMVWIS
jgi:hypothetical protein